VRVRRHRVLAALPFVGAVLLAVSFVLGFAAVEPPGYPDTPDTPCGRVFLAPQRWTVCGDPMARQTAWVIGLGVPGALALLVPPSLRLNGAEQRTVLVLVLIGAAAGYAVVAVIDHFTSSPIAFFGASVGVIVFPGFYLGRLALESGELIARA
jgi:hypothetical protein